MNFEPHLELHLYSTDFTCKSLFTQVNFEYHIIYRSIQFKHSPSPDILRSKPIFTIADLRYICQLKIYALFSQLILSITSITSACSVVQPSLLSHHIMSVFCPSISFLWVKSWYPCCSFDLLYLVGGLEHFLFFHTLEIIIPIDFHIFQRNWHHQPGYSTRDIWEINMFNGKLHYKWSCSINIP